jgi:hypothetical protein
MRRELRNAYLQGRYRSKPGRPVFVITPYGRTGSYLFLDYLGQLMPTLGEVLNQNTHQGLRRSARRSVALRHIGSSLVRVSPDLVACKLILGQMAMHDISFADLGREFPTSQYILIYRRSILDQYLSREIARRTRRWHSKGTPFSGTILLDRDAAIGYIAEYRKTHHHLSNIIPDALPVAYEDLVTDPQLVFRRDVCPFLRINYRPVETHLRKRVRRSPNEVVENWIEVADLVSEAVTL